MFYMDAIEKLTTARIAFTLYFPGTQESPLAAIAITESLTNEQLQVAQSIGGALDARQGTVLALVKLERDS